MKERNWPNLEIYGHTHSPWVIAKGAVLYFQLKNWKGAVVSFSEADRQKGENVGIKCPLVSRSAFGKCLSFVWVTYLVSLKQFFTLKMRILIIYIFMDVWEG